MLEDPGLVSLPASENITVHYKCVSLLLCLCVCMHVCLCVLFYYCACVYSSVCLCLCVFTYWSCSKMAFLKLVVDTHYKVVQSLKKTHPAPNDNCAV